MIEDFQSMKEDKLYPYGTVRLLRAIAQETCDVEISQAYDRFIAALEGTDLHFHPVSSDYVLTMFASLRCSDEEKHQFVLLPSASGRARVLLERIEFATSLIHQEKVTERGIYLS